MGNENLKNALRTAGLTPEEFADIIQVDPKTVQRWVSGTTTPYPRHRAAISRALDVIEHDLWPEHSPPPPETASRSGVRCEAVGTWAYADGHRGPDPTEFVTNSEGPLEILTSRWAPGLTAELAGTLVTQADTGRQIRILASHPSRHLEPMLGNKRIAIRIDDAAGEHGLIRAGEWMLLTFALAFELREPPVLFELTRSTGDGLFERVSANFELLWNNATDVLANHHDLDRWLHETERNEAPHEPGESEGNQADLFPQGEVAALGSEPGQTALSEGEPRRWPGRPN
jgi:hypothetical protein